MLRRKSAVSQDTITELGIPFGYFGPEDCKSQDNVDTIPETTTVTGIDFDGSENFTNYPKYTWSGGSLYPLYLLQ